MLILFEVVALATGLTVIIIETAIIFMLKNHVSQLDKNLIANEKLLGQFQKTVDQHLTHLDEHSHKVEARLESLINEVCGPVKHESNRNEIKHPVVS